MYDISEEEMEPVEENLVKVYIEIEQFSNVKYEYNKKLQELEVDRILDQPYVYPYAYGYIPNTLADDGDDLDVLILTNLPLKNDAFYSAYIVGALQMEDEKGQDEKVLCVLKGDYQKNTKDIENITPEVKENISSFFANYKNTTPNKWSKVGGFINKSEAVKLYKKTKLNQLKKIN